MTTAEHSNESSYRELLIEHIFIGELLQYYWLNGSGKIEVLKPQADNGGYDIVLEANGVARYVQLKSRLITAKTPRVNINSALFNKLNWCVIWIWFKEDTQNNKIELKEFWWFGNDDGHKLQINDFKIAKHTKANSKGIKAERPNIKVIPKKEFVKIEDVEKLICKLFGHACLNGR